MSNLVKDFARNAYEFVMADPTKPGHADMMKAAYDEIYVAAFPIEDERQPLDLWMSRTNPDSQSPNKYAIILAGTNLEDPKTRRIEGISVGIYYTEAQVGLMAYNAIRPSCRGGGMGHAMVDARINALHEIAERHGQKLRGVFLEVNDPEKVKAEDDSFDPAKRLAIFKKWGAEEVAINYVQPALDDSQEKVDSLKLLSYPTRDGLRPSADAVYSFLYAVYKGCGCAEPETNSDFQRMKEEIFVCEKAPKDALPRSFPEAAP